MQKDFKAFQNRLIKMAKHYGKWARRTQTYCYRIYDADLPDFPFTVDKYEERILVSIYEKDRTNQIEDDIFYKTCLKIIQDYFITIPEDHFYIKGRRVQRGKSQYDKFDKIGKGFEVRENQYQFWVNLSDYLDSGLFLDHRQTRKMVGEWSKGKAVLNLFAYTGSFSVYAAGGGATSVDTIDLSNTYLDWAKTNFELNNLNPKRHRFIRADVMKWLLEPKTNKYDLIVCDPPTFSNSKKMKGIFDVQRDHEILLKHCLYLLSPNGRLIFSTNNRQFKMRYESDRNIRGKEITLQTIPMDFNRNKKIHRCYLFETVDA